MTNILKIYQAFVILHLIWMAEGRKKKGILALEETKMRFFAFFLCKNLQS